MPDPVLAALKALVAQEGTQLGAAIALDVSGSYLSDLLLGKRAISARIAAKLGYDYLRVARRQAKRRQK